MKIGITHRLFLAILMAAGLAVVSMVLIMQWNVSRGFLRYVNSVEKSWVTRLAAKLEQGYGEGRNWNFVAADQERWRTFVMSALPDEGPHRDELAPGDQPERGQRGERPAPDDASHPGAPPIKPLPPHVAGQFIHRLYLLDAQKRVLLGQGSLPADYEATPLHHNDRVVGYLGLVPLTKLSAPPERRFLKDLQVAFILVAGIIVVVAAGLSFLLTRRLVQPLRDLARATNRLTAGEFTVRVPVASSDELGRLAADFNALALTLEKNEQARRQWVADISHELRTPLSVLRSEVEALLDGVRPATPDSIYSLHGEVMRLGRLVDDLYQLSMSDLGALTYKKEIVDLGQLLAEDLAAYGEKFRDKGIRFSTGLPEAGQTMIFGDAARLHQLFNNLLDNTLKYTEEGGKLRVQVQREKGEVLIDFQDSAPGVPLSELDRLFDRLYRVESSRNRSTGGAGLGLAICRNIVEAHNGSITARQSPLGGLWIRISVPQQGA